MALPGSVVSTVSPVAAFLKLYKGMSGVRRTAATPVLNMCATEWAPLLGALWQLVQLPRWAGKPATCAILSGRLLKMPSPRALAPRAWSCADAPGTAKPRQAPNKAIALRLKGGQVVAREHIVDPEIIILARQPLRTAQRAGGGQVAGGVVGCLCHEQGLLEVDNQALVGRAQVFGSLGVAAHRAVGLPGQADIERGEALGRVGAQDASAHSTNR